MHGCQHGSLPLTALLNVEYRMHQQAGVTGHEARLAPNLGSYTTSAEAPAQPLASTKSALGSAAGWAATGAAVPSEHAQRAVEFVSAEPFKLSAFQDFVAAALHPRAVAEEVASEEAASEEAAPEEAASEEAASDEAAVERGRVARGLLACGLRWELLGLLERVVRMKGVIWFDECRSERWLFHLSGRQRVHLEHDGSWQGRPAIRLVAIGEHWSPTAPRLRAALEGLCVAPAGGQASEEPPPCLPCEGDAEGDGAASAVAPPIHAMEPTADDLPMPTPTPALMASTADDAVGGRRWIGCEACRVREWLGQDRRFEVVHAAARAPTTAMDTTLSTAASTTAAAADVPPAPGVPPPAACARKRTGSNDNASCSGVPKRGRAGVGGEWAAAPGASPAPSQQHCCADVVHFQLVGAAVCGLSRAQLEQEHGVDVSALNATFVHELNSSRLAAEATAVGGAQAKPCLLGAAVAPVPTSPRPPRFTVRFAVGGACRFEHVWPVIDQVADDIIDRELLGKLKLCRCDRPALPAADEAGQD